MNIEPEHVRLATELAAGRKEFVDAVTAQAKSEFDRAKQVVGWRGDGPSSRHKSFFNSQHLRFGVDFDYIAVTTFMVSANYSATSSIYCFDEAVTKVTVDLVC